MDAATYSTEPGFHQIDWRLDHDLLCTSLKSNNIEAHSRAGQRGTDINTKCHAQTRNTRRHDAPNLHQSTLANASTQLSQKRRASGPIPMSLPHAAPPCQACSPANSFQTTDLLTDEMRGQPSGSPSCSCPSAPATQSRCGRQGDLFLTTRWNTTRASFPKPFTIREPPHGPLFVYRIATVCFVRHQTEPSSTQDMLYIDYGMMVLASVHQAA